MTLEQLCGYARSSIANLVWMAAAACGEAIRVQGQCHGRANGAVVELQLPRSCAGSRKALCRISQGAELVPDRDGAGSGYAWNCNLAAMELDLISRRLGAARAPGHNAAVALQITRAPVLPAQPA